MVQEAYVSIFDSTEYKDYVAARDAELPEETEEEKVEKYLKSKEFWISAFDVSATKDFTKNDWKGKNVLLFGSEGFGIKAKTLENSDFKFRVKMNDNIESLNISNTVSVVCHHIFQKKNRD